MPSPLPGMNPYIEQPAVWQDFHNRVAAIAAEVIAAQVLPRYFVKIEEHVFIHEPAAGERFPLGRPDVSVHPGDTGAGAPRPGSTATAAPGSVGMPAGVEEERLPYLEIRDRTDRSVVTVVELLSPVNKQTRSDRDQYRAKVRGVLASGANFVEIDLPRGGPRMPWARLPACDYYVVVSRPADRDADDPRADLWPLRLRDPLPIIPIPLRPGEPDAALDLQALVHRIHDSAGYRLFIYDSDPEPPLSGPDAVWAAQLLNPPGPPA